ncbi:hypothetical protein HYQ46_005067 [Verticillium longisporum]|nr:hypothetical protein HYQ46_005067 [Verticillium longisporum]
MLFRDIALAEGPGWQADVRALKVGTIEPINSVGWAETQHPQKPRGARLGIQTKEACMTRCPGGRVVAWGGLHRHAWDTTSGTVEVGYSREAGELASVAGQQSGSLSAISEPDQHCQSFNVHFCRSHK